MFGEEGRVRLAGDGPGQLEQDPGAEAGDGGEGGEPPTVGQLPLQLANRLKKIWLQKFGCHCQSWVKQLVKLFCVRCLVERVGNFFEPLNTGLLDC